jgi:hypothetical protein
VRCRRERGGSCGPPGLAGGATAVLLASPAQVQKAAVLAPVAGALVGLWRAAGGEAGGEAAAASREALLDAWTAAWGAHSERQLRFLTGHDWHEGLPLADGPGRRTARELCTMVDAAVARRAAQAGGGPGGSGPGEEVPEELLDPITSLPMRDPVVLPDSQVRRAGLACRGLQSQGLACQGL